MTTTRFALAIPFALALTHTLGCATSDPEDVGAEEIAVTPYRDGISPVIGAYLTLIERLHGRAAVDARHFWERAKNTAAPRDVERTRELSAATFLARFYLGAFVARAGVPEQEWWNDQPLDSAFMSPAQISESGIDAIVVLGSRCSELPASPWVGDFRRIAEATQARTMTGIQGMPESWYGLGGIVRATWFGAELRGFPAGEAAYQEAIRDPGLETDPSRVAVDAALAESDGTKATVLELALNKAQDLIATRDAAEDIGVYFGEVDQDDDTAPSP